MEEKNPKIKKCELCGEKYTPALYQEESQRYCSKLCKRRKQDEVRKERGVASGGYNRTVYIKVWLKGKGRCHYCKCPINVEDKWNIDHTIPRSVLASSGCSKIARKKIKNDVSNMEIVCQSCNHRKGSLDGKSFRKIIKETTNGLEENKIIG